MYKPSQDPVIIFPNFDEIGHTRAGRLLWRLDSPVILADQKTYNFIDSLINRYEEFAKQAAKNSNDAHLVSGLMGDQEQVLKELEAYILKCLAQQTKEQNAAKKAQALAKKQL